jgi:P-type Mg2+ transporter
MTNSEDCYWSSSAVEQLRCLESSAEGLTSSEAARRLTVYGPNRLRPRRKDDWLSLLLAQFKSPITLILIGAAGLSFFLQDPVDATIILGIVLISALLGFWQEHSAANALKKLLAIVTVKASVLRDGQEIEIPVYSVVPGDVILVSAGSTIPGDCLILESKDLFVDEATLTGETYPAEKQPGVLSEETSLGHRTNLLFLGTHVVSGTAKAVVVRTARQTEFGKVSDRLQFRPPETDFEHGIRRFGYFLTEVTLLLVFCIFAANVLLHRPVLESLLFSLALAVGLTPQLLPAIISVNLAHGAKRMADEDVIVRRLSSIENFGSMDILCSDKTGTLTEGVIRLHAAEDAAGVSSDKVLQYAYLNACFESGFTNPIDEAIRAGHPCDVTTCRKLDEVPYDFIRKRLSVLVAMDNHHVLITKGAVDNVLAVCSAVETAKGSIVPLDSVRSSIQDRFHALSNEGFRTLGVAYRTMDSAETIAKAAEADMVFLGFLVLEDPPKADIVQTVQRLGSLGVGLKMITGDNRLVAANVARQVGLSADRILTGGEIRQMSDDALRQQANASAVFAEVEPNQKERIILALKQASHVVGYMGDGINDASALHSADVGISVDQAVDVAKEAADIVLLKRDLGVLVRGVQEGRATFSNTLKYVYMATSANFGNMFSMAGASLFLPFLPLLPKQILLMNVLTDFPEMTIATDSVDEELLAKPRRWDIRAIRNFMLVFGTLSSVFDYLTFGALLLVLRANEEGFRTGWFLESVISASLIVLVVRTRKLFWRSKPSVYLLWTTVAVVAVTLVLPYTPVASPLGFRPVAPAFLLMLAAIVASYIAAAEVAKRWFYRSLAKRN